MKTFIFNLHYADSTLDRTVEREINLNKFGGTADAVWFECNEIINEMKMVDSVTCYFFCVRPSRITVNRY